MKKEQKTPFIEGLNQFNPIKVRKVKQGALRHFHGKKVDAFTPGCIGHTTSFDDAVGRRQLIVQDFLVDSSRISKGGESVNPLEIISFPHIRGFITSIYPEACYPKQRFLVKIPNGVSTAGFSLNFGRRAVHWVTGQGNGTYDILPVTIQFYNLTGVAPVITYGHLFISNGVNNAYYIYITGSFSSNFSFSHIVISATLPQRHFLPAIDYYTLLSYSYPFGIPGAENPNYCVFYYISPDLLDKGPIINIY